MELRSKFKFAFALGAASVLSMGLAAEERQGIDLGNIHVPGSSLELPEDVGVRMHTHHLILKNTATGDGPNGGMTPTQIQSFYGFTSATGGQGVIAIIDAYDYPTALNDFNVFAGQFGLPLETSTNVTASTNKVFQVVYASGTKPAGNASWNEEAALDIEWAHAMAPNAKIVLVEATSATNANLYAAVKAAAALAGVEEISMSWGGSESSGEASGDSTFNVSGPLMFASAGDSGGVVEYPSCSPYVIAAGGTSVTTNSSGVWTAEAAWSDGGGGNSRYEKKPTWQSGISKITGTGRGVPDISWDADPNSGVCVYDSTSYEGYVGWLVFGGTSVSSPSLAGAANSSLPAGTFANTTAFLTNLYGNFKTTPSLFRDITTGTAGRNKAGAGWDYCTGVGVPTGPKSF